MMCLAMSVAWTTVFTDCVLTVSSTVVVAILRSRPSSSVTCLTPSTSGLLSNFVGKWLHLQALFLPQKGFLIFVFVNMGPYENENYKTLILRMFRSQYNETLVVVCFSSPLYLGKLLIITTNCINMKSYERELSK